MESEWIQVLFSSSRVKETTLLTYKNHSFLSLGRLSFDLLQNYGTKVSCLIGEVDVIQV